MGFIDTYAKVRAQHPAGVRGLLRSAALTGLAAKERLLGEERFLERPRVQFIYLHHVFKDEERGLHRLLDVLARDHTFIGYSEAVERVVGNVIDRPYIVFSSDDGFKNNLRAAEILAEHGAKGCFFINPALIGETDPAAITKYCAEVLHFPPVEFLDWDEVDLIRAMGHEVGSHTMRHVNIAKTSRTEVMEDMQRTFSVIKERCGAVRHFAFPYGRYAHFSEVGRQACFDAGFISCATAERGCHIPGEGILRHEDLRILRDHVVLDWKMAHIMHFLIANAKHALAGNNGFPWTTAG